MLEFYVTNMLRVPVCLGHEYFLSSSPTEIKEFEFRNLTLDRNTGVFTINPQEMGTFDFYIIVKATESLKIAAKQFRANVRAYCLNENLLPVETSYNFEVQKNKLIQGSSTNLIETSNKVQ